VTGIGVEPSLPKGEGAPDLAVLGSPKVVLETLDIVLTKIGADLDFDENKRLRTGVSDSVQPSDRNIDRFADVDITHLTVEDQLTRTVDDEPMFGTMRMTLVAETFVWLYDDLFYLVAVGTTQNRVATPRTLLALCRRQLEMLSTIGTPRLCPGPPAQFLPSS